MTEGKDFNFKQFNEHMLVNFSTPAMLIQALNKNIYKNKHFKDRSNMVINIIDAKVKGLNPDYYTYTLSKLSLSGFTKLSALSYAPNLRVNGIAPGIILPAEGQAIGEFEDSHIKNILKSSATIKDLYLALDFLTNSKSVTGHISFRWWCTPRSSERCSLKIVFEMYQKLLIENLKINTIYWCI